MIILKSQILRQASMRLYCYFFLEKESFRKEKYFSGPRIDLESQK